MAEAKTRRRGHGVVLDDGAVLGDVAQHAGPQGGHGQAQLQTGPADFGIRLETTAAALNTTESIP